MYSPCRKWLQSVTKTRVVLHTQTQSSGLGNGLLKPHQGNQFVHNLASARDDAFGPNKLPRHVAGDVDIATGSSLRLQSESLVCASPMKSNPKGEDAAFVSADGYAIGVADGVGSWKEHNIDAGKFSRELMLNAQHYFESQSLDRDPKKAMQVAYQLSMNPGTCTACIISIDGYRLTAANFGDTGFLILRPELGDLSTKSSVVERLVAGDEARWRLYFKSFEMQHFFNCPLQMGSGVPYAPKLMAETSLLHVKEGDLLITGTDGVFDNLSTDDIEDLVVRHPLKSRSVQEPAEDVTRRWIKSIAESIVAEATTMGFSTKASTPFAIQARRAGFEYSGGKLDDVAVVVSLVYGGHSQALNS